MQPIAAHEVPIRSHKYQVGEMVYFTSPTFGRAAATGSYTVVKLLPSEGDDYQYRIKSSGEAFERVAKESQLDRALSCTSAAISSPPSLMMPQPSRGAGCRRMIPKSMSST